MRPGGAGDHVDACPAASLPSDGERTETEPSMPHAAPRRLFTPNRWLVRPIAAARLTPLAFSRIWGIIGPASAVTGAGGRVAREGQPVEQAPDYSLRNRLLPPIVVIVIVAFLGLLGFSLWSPDRGGTLGAGGRINTIGSLMPLGDRQAANFTVNGLDGQPISLEQFRGKTVVLNFWASWCPPCKDEAPVLESFHRTVDPETTVLLGINIWELEPADGQAFIHEHGLTYPNAVDNDGATTIDYGVAGIPETFFIGPDGTLLGKYNGPVKSVEQLQGFIEQLSTKR